MIVSLSVAVALCVIAAVAFFRLVPQRPQELEAIAAAGRLELPKPAAFRPLDPDPSPIAFRSSDRRRELEARARAAASSSRSSSIVPIARAARRRRRRRIVPASRVLLALAVFVLSILIALILTGAPWK